MLRGVIILSLGFHYLQAVYQGNRGFMKLSVAGRVMAVGTFWQYRDLFRITILYEAVMGLLTAACLVLERNKGNREKCLKS